MNEDKDVERGERNAKSFESEIRRLTAENESLRAKCAEMRRLIDLQITAQTEDGLTDAELEEMKVLLRAVADNPGQSLLGRLAKAEEMLAREEEAHAQLQSRCFDGFPTHSSIFDALREAEARNEKLERVQSLVSDYIRLNPGDWLEICEALGACEENRG